MRVRPHPIFTVICSLIVLIALPLQATQLVAESSDIPRSPADTREYRAIRLDNGLQVMLVSDANAEQAAAALDVHVGSGHDPLDRQGLAHYLEHMLFLGTEKYPQAGEYQQYISEHGGSHNAYTVLDHTNYFFNVTPDYFEGALDRFAQFFIAPLFNEQYVTRERAIVDSEFRARKDDEGRRLWAARREIFNPEHPRTQYSVGNLETLADRDNDPVREDLIEFYSRYYHASRMALVVVSQHSLDQLQSWVEKKFNAIPESGEAYTPFSQTLVLPEDVPVQLTLKPLKDTRSVTFSFPVPSVWDQEDAKPAQYLSNLLGHEGEGSLLALLKARTWANSLSAGLGYSDAVQATFDISIGLSKQGLQHIEEIGSLLFAYVALVREQGVLPLYFEELAQLAELEFRFQEKSSEASLAQGLAARLHRLQPQEVLSVPYLISRYDPDALQRILEQLKPGKLQLIISDPAMQSSTQTQWYDVQFSRDNIAPKWLKTWQKPALISELALPGPNPFVPEQLDMLLADKANHAVPQKLDNTPGIELWHQTELTFAQPKAELYFSLRSPHANDSPKAAVLTGLYVKAVQEALNTYSYPAYLAGLDYRIYPHSRGLSVRISGYSARQAQLLEKIISSMLSLEITPRQFELYMENLRQSLENSIKGRPSGVVLGGVYDALLTSSWSAEEKLTVLDEVDLSALKKHYTRVLDQPELLVLSIGNVTRQDSLHMAELVAQLKNQNEGQVVPRARVRRLAPGRISLIESAALPDDAAIALVYQGVEASVAELAATQLLGTLIHTPYYQALRTEGQIGYIVQAFAYNILDTPGLAFSVQSNSHSVSDIVLRTQIFIKEFKEILEEMPEETFAASKAGLIAQLVEEEKQLSEVAGRHWSELDRQAYQFDSRERLVAAIQTLDKPALIAYSQQLFSDRQGAALLSYSFGQQSTTLDLPSRPKVDSFESLEVLRQANDDYFKH